MLKVKGWLAVGVIAAGLAVAGRGSDDDSGSDSTSGCDRGGKTGTVTVGVALDSTGPAGSTGVEGKKGIDLAVEEANAAKALGDATLAVDVKDGASDPKQAASLMTPMVKDYPVVSQGMTSGGRARRGPDRAAGQPADRDDPRRRPRHRRDR